MTRPIRRTELAQVVLDGRRAGELLGEHGEIIWFSTREMHPGPRAQNYDPDARGWRYSTIEHPDGTVELAPIPHDPTGEQATTYDPTAILHLRYRKLIAAYRDAAQALTEFIGDNRPDRLVPADEDQPQQWCRSCLRLGKCEPRFRGDLCAWDYRFHLTYHMDPPLELLRARHEGRRITEQMVDRALAAARQEKRRVRNVRR